MEQFPVKMSSKKIGSFQIDPYSSVTVSILPEYITQSHNFRYAFLACIDKKLTGRRPSAFNSWKMPVLMLCYACEAFIRAWKAQQGMRRITCHIIPTFIIMCKKDKETHHSSLLCTFPSRYLCPSIKPTALNTKCRYG